MCRSVCTHPSQRLAFAQALMAHKQLCVLRSLYCAMPSQPSLVRSFEYICSCSRNNCSASSHCCGRTRAQAALADLLARPDAASRASAARGLIRAGTPSAIESLRRQRVTETDRRVLQLLKGVP